MGKKKRKRATKKRKQSKAQLDNLTKGWDRIPKPPPSPKFKTCGVGPTAKTYGRHNPSAATITKIDILHDKAVEAIARIDTARSLTESRSVKERIMFLQFTLKFLEKHKCLMSVAVENAVNFFCWRRQDAYELLKAYLDDPDQKNVPPAKRLKPRGRASLLFKERYADRFMVLKNNHMTEILQYVRLANAERGGMVTMGRIQAHMLTKFGILFKKWNIYYCLTKRLKLKFSVSARPKLQFSPARIRATRIFCKKSDEAIKLERAGTHIIVYIDESYCYMNHRQSHTWNEDGVPVNRTGGKGTLFIIVHALTKDGPLLPEGERFAVDEWSAGVQPTTEMIFRAKFATKHHVRDYHDTMDSEFFMYWVQNRLVPAFEQRYPAKKMILMLDNAPYHHALVSNGFRPDGMTKEDIADRLRTLPRKRGVRRLTKIKVKPYENTQAPPPLPSTTVPDTWSQYVFLDNTGELWLIDGVNDEGYGDAVIYSRVGARKAGSVESTLVEEFTATRARPG